MIDGQLIAVSVIVPVYNAAAYLPRCVQSLLGQSLNGVQILLVDDGSTDPSGAMIDQYAAEAPGRVLALHRSNGGAAAARNLGITHATGEYLAFVDCDDWVEPDMLQKMYRAAVASGAGLAACDFMQFWPDGTQKRIAGAEGDQGLEDRKRILLGMPGVANKLILRALFTGHKLVFPEQSYYEDLALHLIVPALCTRAVYVPKAFYHYRQHEQSKTSTYRLERSMEVLPALDAALEHYPLRQGEALWEEFVFKAVRHCFMTPSLRALRAAKAEGGAVVEILKRSLDERLPGWRKNKYLKTLLSFRQRLLLRLLDTGWYRFTGGLFH